VAAAQLALTLASSRLDQAAIEVDSAAIRVQVLTRKEDLTSVLQNLGIVLSSLSGSDDPTAGDIETPSQLTEMTEEDFQIQQLRLFRAKLQEMFGTGTVDNPQQLIPVVRTEEDREKTKCWAEALIRQLVRSRRMKLED
jgi:hypothetical protein